MKADDRILSAARNAKGCPFQGSSRVPQPWQDLKASRALKTRLFGDRGFESFFLRERVTCEPGDQDRRTGCRTPLLKAAVATDASQGMMSHQQGVETRSAVERIAAFAAAARPERLTTDIRQLFKRNILDSLGCAIRVAALIEEARLRSAA